MRLVNGVKDDLTAAKKLSIPWWGVLSIAAVSALGAWLFDSLGRLDLDLPALNCVAVLVFVLILKRRELRYTWFWTTMIVITALHIPLVVFVPWTTKWVPAMAIAGIDCIDLCVILAVLAAVRSVAAKTSA